MKPHPMLAAAALSGLTTACHEGESRDPPPEVPAEVCNFIDDDHDGSVDEGFEWIVSEWELAFEGREDLAVSRVAGLRLVDGNVAVIAVDGLGLGPSLYDHGLVSIVSEDGVLLRGPLRVRANLQGTSGLGPNAVALGSNGHIACVFSTSSLELPCPANGCPIIGLFLDEAEVSADTLDGEPFKLSIPGIDTYAVFDIAALPVGYLLTVLDVKRSLHLVQIDGSGSFVGSKQVTHAPARSAYLALAGEQLALVHDEPVNPGGAIHLELRVAPYLAEPLLAWDVASGTATSVGNSPGLVASDALVSLGFTSVGPTGQSQVYTSSSTWDGEIRTSGRPIGSMGGISSDIAIVDDNLVFLNETGTGAIELTRRRLDGSSVDAPGEPVVVPTSTRYVSMVPTEHGILLLRGSADDPGEQLTSRRNFEVASARCAAPP